MTIKVVRNNRSKKFSKTVKTKITTVRIAVKFKSKKAI